MTFENWKNDSLADISIFREQLFIFGLFVTQSYCRASEELGIQSMSHIEPFNDTFRVPFHPLRLSAAGPIHCNWTEKCSQFKCSTEERKSCWFQTACGWVNNDKLHTFRWTIPLSVSTCACAFVPVRYLIPLTSEPSLLSADIRQKDKSAWWKTGDSFLHKQTKHDLTSHLHLRLPITPHISTAFHRTEQNADIGTVKTRKA